MLFEELEKSIDTAGKQKYLTLKNTGHRSLRQLDRLKPLPDNIHIRLYRYHT